jgi:hypothetical protein
MLIKIMRITSPEYYLAHLIVKILSKKISLSVVSSLISTTLYLLKSVGIFRSLSILNNILRFVQDPKNLLLNLRLLFTDPSKNPIMNPVATQMVLK